jgi:hypothetical protein
MNLGKYSFGIGDRFGCEGVAQLKAIELAKKKGIEITPVWNKSNREHTIIHSSPSDTRLAAANAIKQQNWDGQYYVDADHINLQNVDQFIDSCDFFTIDVADYIGKKADNTEISKFITSNNKYTGDLKIPGIMKPIKTTIRELEKIAEKYLYAAIEAGKIYRHIEKMKGIGNFITEVSMDEVNDPQTPIELFFILSAMAAEKIPLQTIAPKFTGRFNKGVDYSGNIAQFGREFEDDLMVIDFAIKEFKLPENLKLSVHSGSDKFSIYPVMGNIIKKHDKGIHVKTAGTTWLEEVIGLAMSGEAPLKLAKTIYTIALGRYEELCGPYATVIDIDKKKLPTSSEIQQWNGEKFANSLRHIPENPDYNPNFRQLIHVGYKVAVECGEEFYANIKKHSGIIGRQVTENLYNRHICRLFDIKG